jgi:hypothetical protein
MEEDYGRLDNSPQQVHESPEQEHKDWAHTMDPLSSAHSETSSDASNEEKHDDNAASMRSSEMVQTRPKPSPDYVEIAALSDNDGDHPGPRCGHTLTTVVGADESNKDHAGPLLVLFGGAISIEDGSQADCSQTIGGGAGISKVFSSLSLSLHFL